MLEWVTIVVIGAGLAMDAFAVSIATGAGYKQLNVRHALRMALFFGLFQAVMPVIGWAAGQEFKDLIADFDHWVAFGILVIVGAKMIYESFSFKRGKGGGNVAALRVLLLLSVATSIDALAVGITLSLITDYIFAAVAIIGVVTFILSYAGWAIGQRMGHFFENKIEIAGGVILIAIGTKILIEHTLMGR